MPDKPEKIPTIEEIKRDLGLEKMEFLSEMSAPEGEPQYDENGDIIAFR